jgi:hypothetical protein
VIATYTSLAVLLATSLAVGSALHAILRVPELPWLAPVSGLAVLLIVAPVAVRLPGEGLTGAVVLVALAVAAVSILGRRRIVPPIRAAILPGLIVGGLVSLPFISNWRFGPLGVSFNDDLGPHFAWADALRTGNERLFDSIIQGYPIGPHAVTASVGQLLGIDALGPFTAILLAVPILTAVAALQLLRPMPPGRRVAGAVSAGLPYLAVAYFAQGAFKEPLVGLLLVSGALVFQQALLDPSRSVAYGLLLGLHTAAAVSAYSFPGAYPFVGGALTALALALVVRRGRVSRFAVRNLLRGGTAAVGFLVLALLPQAARLASFKPVEAAVPNKTSYGGNFIGKISGYEVFGVWRSADFRLFPPDVFYAGILSGLAAAVAVYAAVWWLAQRQVALPATAAATLAIWSVADRTELPYISAKVLVIAAPTILLLGVSALLFGASSPSPLGSIAHGAVAAFFIAATLSSSTLVLRNGNVGPLAHANELSSLRGLIRNQRTLFLGQDDFAAWELQGSRISFAWVYAVHSMIPFELRSEKPFTEGSFFDFDSVQPSSLDAFRYVITTRTSFASEPPANWRPLRRTRSFVLWQREGRTLPRRVLAEVGGPGALLDCSTPEGRRLRKGKGKAAVRPPPVVAATAWTIGGAPAPLDGLGFAYVPFGHRAERTIDLPGGSWDLSLQYTSPSSLAIQSGGFSTSLPATLDRRGPFWPLGRVDSKGGAVTLSVAPSEPKLNLADRGALLGNLVATRAGTRTRIVPLREACGRYVDWYR